MIKWYKDNEIGIFFSIIPKIQMRYITPYKNDLEINKKPFLNLEKVSINLRDYQKEKNYYFTIQKGYCWDGASIPRFFWRSIGPKTDNKFLIPSLIHDVLCENHSYIENDRYFSTKIFDKLLIVSKVCPFKRWVMFHTVDNFQKTRGWKNEP